MYVIVIVPDTTTFDFNVLDRWYLVKEDCYIRWTEANGCKDFSTRYVIRQLSEFADMTGINSVLLAKKRFQYHTIATKQEALRLAQELKSSHFSGYNCCIADKE